MTRGLATIDARHNGDCAALAEAVSFGIWLCLAPLLVGLVLLEQLWSLRRAEGCDAIGVRHSQSEAGAATFQGGAR